MKSLLVLFLGGLAGVLGTVLIFSIDPDFEPDERDGAGGGNARLSLDEEAIAGLIAAQIAELTGVTSDTRVEVTVDPAGVLRVQIGVGTLGVGLRSSIVLNPNIVDGRLVLDVVEASLGELAVPEELARLIEAPIQQRVNGLAGEFEYRLTSIATTDRRLTLEIRL